MFLLLTSSTLPIVPTILLRRAASPNHGVAPTMTFKVALFKGDVFLLAAAKHEDEKKFLLFLLAVVHLQMGVVVVGTDQSRRT